MFGSLVINNRIYIATLLSLEKRCNAQKVWRRNVGKQYAWSNCIAMHTKLEVLSWRAWAISFVADKRLGLSCLWWNTWLTKQKCKAAFFIFVTCQNHWHGRHVAFWNPCKGHDLYSSKSTIFLFVSTQHWILWRSNEMPKPLRKPILGNASSREVSMFWQVWITTKEASQFQSLILDLRIKFGFAKYVQYYRKSFGFGLFSPNMRLVTCVTWAVLSRMKWPPPHQSKHTLTHKP